MSAVTLRIDGEFGICRAAELKQRLLASLDDALVVELDLSAVTELDSAGLQILMLVDREAKARCGQMRLVAQSPAVEQVLGLLNLSSYFHGPDAAAAGASASLAVARSCDES